MRPLIWSPPLFNPANSLGGKYARVNCDLTKNQIYDSIDLSCPLGPEREKVSDGLTAEYVS